ncbi:MAG: endonuclease NucS domain-containing protein [Thermoplasmata archaeon]
MRKNIISLLQEGKDREEIVDELNVSPGSVSAIKAHLTMGTYSSSDTEEMIDALETTFGLERDLQKALRHNIDQLEEGLKIIDDGKEMTTEAGRIDITAKDEDDNIVVVELKAGTASPDSVAQILSYMSTLHEEKERTTRGILVAGDFSDRVIYASKVVPNLTLKQYSFNFNFEEI